MNNYKKSECFEDFKDILEILFITKKESKTEEKDLSLKDGYMLYEGILQKITNKYFFSYSYNNHEVNLSYIDENNNIKSLKKKKFNFFRKIYSASLSLKKDKIYICLKNIKKVKIFNCDLDNKLMEDSNDEIKGDNNSSSHFNKCIEVTDELIATSDNKEIVIWKKDETTKVYLNITSFGLKTETCDLLFLNNEYFISSQPFQKTIIFFNINNLQSEKIIKNIDSIISSNCLLIINEYIIVNCKNGISIILKETKEEIQFIENCYDKIIKENKKIYLDNDNNIYILYVLETNKNMKKIFIEVMKMENKSFKLIEKYKKVSIEDNKILEIVLMNKSNIIIWGNELHILFNQ